jgi:hypothetical protein
VVRLLISFARNRDRWLTRFDLWSSPSCITIPGDGQHMIGKCLSKDQLGVMRFLLGRMLDLDFDSRVLFISFIQVTPRNWVTSISGS